MGCGATPGCPEATLVPTPSTSADPSHLHVQGQVRGSTGAGGVNVAQHRGAGDTTWIHPHKEDVTDGAWGAGGQADASPSFVGCPVVRPAAASAEKRAASLGAYPERQPTCIFVSPPVSIPVTIVSLHLPRKLSAGSRSLRTWPRGVGRLWICGPQLIL